MEEDERKACIASCAGCLCLSRSEAQLMAGEMSAQEWRTVSAVLKALQSRMLADADFHRQLED